MMSSLISARLPAAAFAVGEPLQQYCQPKAAQHRDAADARISEPLIFKGPCSPLMPGVRPRGILYLWPETEVL